MQIYIFVHIFFDEHASYEKEYSEYLTKKILLMNVTKKRQRKEIFLKREFPLVDNKRNDEAKK